MICKFAKTCSHRMAHGDMPNGCDAVERTYCKTAKVLEWRYPKNHIERIQPKTPAPLTSMLSGYWKERIGVAR